MRETRLTEISRQLLTPLIEKSEKNILFLLHTDTILKIEHLGLSLLCNEIPLNHLLLVIPVLNIKILNYFLTFLSKY